MIAWVFVVVAFHASCGKFCKLSVHFIFAWYLLRFRSCCNFRKCILLACFPTLSVSYLHNWEGILSKGANLHPKIFEKSLYVCTRVYGLQRARGPAIPSFISWTVRKEVPVVGYGSSKAMIAHQILALTQFKFRIAQQHCKYFDHKNYRD